VYIVVAKHVALRASVVSRFFVYPYLPTHLNCFIQYYLPSSPKYCLHPHSYHTRTTPLSPHSQQVHRRRPLRVSVLLTLIITSFHPYYINIVHRYLSFSFFKQPSPHMAILTSSIFCSYLTGNEHDLRNLRISHWFLASQHVECYSCFSIL
jgi:hypothetical protein